jgi:photosystem II stability/assembly factor-like uncharacterized protein
MVWVRAARLRGDALALVALVALGGLVLSSACGSGSGAPGNDAGNVSAAGWEMIVPPAYPGYTAIALGAPGTIYAVAGDNLDESNGAGYSVTSSHDDGKTWTTVGLTDTGSPIVSVAAVGPTDVYAVGYTNAPGGIDPPVVAKSTDRGATFTLLPPTFKGVFNAVAADGAGNPIGVGYASDGGFFVRSTDGGATWSRVMVAGTQTLFSLWTTASGTIYAGGQAASTSASPDGGNDGGTDGGTDAGAPGGYVWPPGVIVRSDDGGNSWTTVTMTGSSVFSISGTSDGQRIVAVGFGFTEAESDDGGATWQGGCGRNDNNARFTDLGSVWVPDAQSAPYIAADAPYVVRLLICDDTHKPSIETWEALPTPDLGLQSTVSALAGNATEIWAVGTGIFRRPL